MSQSSFEITTKGAQYIKKDDAKIRDKEAPIYFFAKWFFLQGPSLSPPRFNSTQITHESLPSPPPPTNTRLTQVTHDEATVTLRRDDGTSTEVSIFERQIFEGGQAAQSTDVSDCLDGVAG